MSDEKKRDVFKDIVETLHTMDGAPDEYCKELIGRYDDALPDNLPVIPETVGVSIKEQKAKQSLGGALFDSIFAANELGRKNVGPVVNWMVDNDETYANAWLTGVWRAEETGEIVKLKAEYEEKTNEDK